MTDVCTICQDSSIELFIENSDVFYCNECHAIFTSKEKNQNYPSIVTESNKINYFEEFKIKVKQRFSKLTAIGYRIYLKEKTSFNFKNSLDIGAGFGSFVKELNVLGVDAHGIESDEKMKKFSKSDKIIINYFQKNTDLPRYDLISINQALYYFENPFEILNKVKSLLNKNGMIFIVTVNTESALVKKLKIWGEGFKICLSKKNFEMISKSLDLEIVDCTAYRDNFFIDFASYKQGKMNSLIFWIKTFSYFLKINKTQVKDINGNNLFLLLKLR